MFLSFPFAQAIGETPSTDVLTKLTELLAAYGIYALVVFFLFYQQRRTLADLKAAAPENRASMMKIYKATVGATYVLVAIAVAIWIYATFFYQRNTVLWGDVANLTQMTGDPKTSADVVVDQQVTPLQRGVKFYVNAQPDVADPSKVTLNWALVEDGQYTQVPFVFYHRVKELVLPEIQLDPNRSAQPARRDNIQKKKFTVALGTLAAVQGTSLDYQYTPDGKDPAHTIGTLHLLRNGKAEDVLLQEVDSRMPESFAAPGAVLAWFSPPSVFAQNAPISVDSATAARVLPLLGSRDVKQQLAAEQALSSAQYIPWESVRTVVDDSKSTADHALLVHNLASVVGTWSSKGVAVPADIRLNLAKKSYNVSDFKTSAPLFNGLKDADFGNDFTVYYYRGVSNLQTGDYETASKDLAKYASKAPNPGAKAVAQRTLSVANQRAQAKQ
jgi:hypothetical protein